MPHGKQFSIEIFKGIKQQTQGIDFKGKNFCFPIGQFIETRMKSGVSGR
jgi:hypothetical protein